MVKKRLKNVINIGLELDKIDQKVLEELSQILGDLLANNLSMVLGRRIEFQVSLELEVSDTLDLSVDLYLESSEPLPPEILAEIDKRVDEAIVKFEELIAQKFGKTKH
ncbi:MAG: hypothetical protein QXT76_04390 [Sulfolobales archaeon]